MNTFDSGERLAVLELVRTGVVEGRPTVMPQAPGTGADAVARVMISESGGPSRILPAPPPDRSQSELLNWHRDAWLAIPGVERASIGLATGPTAGFLPPAIDGAAEVVAIVREPLSALVAGGAGDVKASVVERGLRGELGVKRFERVRRWANPQTRSIVQPFEDLDDLPFTEGPPEDADRWRELVFDRALPRVRLLPLSDEESGARSLARLMGLRPKRVIRELEASERAQPGRTETLRRDFEELLRSMNWLDAELYEHAMSAVTASS